MRTNEEHWKRGEKEKERRKDGERRERDDKDFGHDGVQHLPHKRKATCGIDDSVADQLHEGAEVAENFGMHPGSSSYDNKTAFKSEWLCYFQIPKFQCYAAMPFFPLLELYLVSALCFLCLGQTFIVVLCFDIP